MANSLLKSLNAVDKNYDKEWLMLAKTRLNEIKIKEVTLIRGEDVFNKIWKKAS